MAKQPDDQLLDHDYDGIREYDNPMPKWWLWTFYATIIFAPLYYILPSPFGEGEGMIARYDADIARHAAQQAGAAPPLELNDRALLALVSQPSVLAEGKAVFGTSCAVCHRADGGGSIGPNLTDYSWIHDGTPTGIHATIVNGALEKGMPPWGRILTPQQVDAVSAYVISLRGTNPPAPKPPEGTVR